MGMRFNTPEEARAVILGRIKKVRRIPQEVLEDGVGDQAVQAGRDRILSPDVETPTHDPENGPGRTLTWTMHDHLKWWVTSSSESHARIAVGWQMADMQTDNEGYAIRTPEYVVFQEHGFHHLGGDGTGSLVSAIDSSGRDRSNHRYPTAEALQYHSAQFIPGVHALDAAAEEVRLSIRKQIVKKLMGEEDL